MSPYEVTSGHFYYHDLTLVPPWISNHMPSKVWDEIIHSQTSMVAPSLGMDEHFHPIYYNGCNYFTMLWLKLNHVSMGGPYLNCCGWIKLVILKKQLCVLIICKNMREELVATQLHCRDICKSSLWFNFNPSTTNCRENLNSFEISLAQRILRPHIACWRLNAPLADLHKYGLIPWRRHSLKVSSHNSHVM